MQSLVLGGNGFIGSHLVDELRASGERVRVFDRGLDKTRGELPDVQYVYGNFDDTALLAEALTGIDVVYHLISTTVPSTSNLDPVADICGNLVNTVKLLELMRLQKISKIVYLSSGGTVYGIPSQSPIPEDHAQWPINSYGINKVAIEKYLQMYQHLHHIDFVSLRASNPYGARQGHTGLQGVIGTYISSLFEGRPIEVWGDGSIVRDFIYVEDLSKLCVAAGHADESGCFNAGSGVGASIQEVIKILQSVMNIDIQPEYKKGRKFDVPHAVLDITQTNKAFEWLPKIDLSEGIELTVNAAINNNTVLDVGKIKAA